MESGSPKKVWVAMVIVQRVKFFQQNETSFTINGLDDTNSEEQNNEDRKLRRTQKI